ncbi:hypothetical protein PO486_13965 [Atlantibacter hermannii]|uniref:hypothetical protein n=1 Tax=Atlantibacter hermannii TaxID=565 RepID=UPI002FF77965
MSGNVDTIKSFLVSLGFDVDGAGQARFEATIKGVTASVVKMGAAVEGAALAVVGFTTQIANGLDKLYWASQRTGATVNGIKALGYAASQTGASAEAAQNSLESLAAFLRNNPGAEGFLNRLGVQTRDASGKLRDTAAIFTGVGQRLNNMPYYRARQYAQMLGIDENTLMAMRRGLSQFSSEFALSAKKIGFNADAAAKQSNIFMTSMRNLSMTLGQARDKIGSNLAGGLAGSIDKLRKLLLDNWPKIENVLMKVIRGVLWAGDVVARVFWRTGQAISSVIDWFKKLDPVTQHLIMLFGGLLVAWRLLNTAFLTSPVGMVITLGAAILALIEDYQTWKEGGKSLIDWGKWEPEIKSALKAMTDLRDSIKAIGVEIARLLNINLKNWTLKGDIENLTKQFGEFGKMMSMIGDLINAIKDGNWKQAYTIGKQLWNQGEGQDSAIPAVNQSARNARAWVGEKWDQLKTWATGDTIADRQNNPGNLRPVGGNGFQTHDTPLAGWMAMARQIRLYFTGKSAAAGYQKLQTIWDIVHKYAPKEDNNDPAGYANFVASMMGVGAKDTLNLSDPQQFSSLLQAMSRKEGYGQWNSPLASVAASQAAAQISQETNINIYGATDPSATGREVADRQMGVNSRLTQQMAGPG